MTVPNLPFRGDVRILDLRFKPISLDTGRGFAGGDGLGLRGKLEVEIGRGKEVLVLRRWAVEDRAKLLSRSR